MGVGWNIRGSYGHMSGAMIPGAMVGLFLAAASQREDWWRRTVIVGAAGAIGFAFGGASSYGKLVGYTNAGWGEGQLWLMDTLWGYGTMFTVGAIWGAIGGGIIGLALTRPRSWIAGFIAPLIAVQLVWSLLSYTEISGEAEFFAGWLKEQPWSALDWNRKAIWDTNWIQATASLAVAVVMWTLWLILGLVSPTRFPKSTRSACLFIAMMSVGSWLGLAIFAGGLGIHFNPESPYNPERADSWASVLGMALVLGVYLISTRNYAALMLWCYGLIAGGIGFATGDFVQTLQRAQLDWLTYKPLPFDAAPDAVAMHYLIGPFKALLTEHGGWPKMEVILGLFIGFGMALGCSRLVRGRLATPLEDDSKSYLNEFCVVLIFVGISWRNFDNNWNDWVRADGFPAETLAIPATYWLQYLGVMLSLLVLYVVCVYRRGGTALNEASPLLKGQLVTMAGVWYFLLVHFLMNPPTNPHVIITAVYFWTSAILVTAYLLRNKPSKAVVVDEPVLMSNSQWLPGWRYAALWLFAICWVCLISFLSVMAYKYAEPDGKSFEPKNLRWPANYDALMEAKESEVAPVEAVPPQLEESTEPEPMPDTPSEPAEDLPADPEPEPETTTEPDPTTEPESSPEPPATPPSTPTGPLSNIGSAAV
jgi:hypothetical protein